VFIALFVLLESVERFVEPPKIETDKLLLVSSLVRPSSSPHSRTHLPKPST
jgi:hypothetical protein